jgi:hypothetical protein
VEELQEHNRRLGTRLEAALRQVKGGGATGAAGPEVSKLQQEVGGGCQAVRTAWMV